MWCQIEVSKITDSKVFLMFINVHNRDNCFLQHIKLETIVLKKRDREGTVTTENLTWGPTMATFDFTTSYRSKILFVDSVDHVEVVFRTTHTQNITNILIDCDYMMTMNHGGRRHTTAAIVPHPRLRCTQTLTLANRLCNKAT